MLNRILYYGFLKPLSLLPFWILYIFSDFCYFVIYKIVGYRTKVVRGNIQRSFPNKTAAEVKKIESQFYHHFCDLIIESIKGFSISSDEAKKRMINENTDLLNTYYEQGRDIILVGGHYGNWELYAVAIGQQIKHQPVALYTPLVNKYLDNKVRDSRSKFGLNMLSNSEIKSIMIDKNSEPKAVIFGADQSPRKDQNAYWLTFLNQDTGVQYGAEKFAKDNNCVVIFGNIYKQKRGYYKAGYQLICENPNETDYGFITETHTKMLEKDIIAAPPFWLWSHRRWKHQRP